MSKDKAPREFWIDENWAVGACDEMHLCVYDKEVDGIHVIDYASYAALESKLAECVAALEFYAASNGLCDNEEVLYINGEVDLIAGKLAREVLAKVKK